MKNTTNSLQSTFEALGLGPPGTPTFSKSITESEILSQSRPRVNRIFENQHLLRNIIYRHETMIQKRWVKKSKSRRRAVLMEAWGQPPMPLSHRPDIVAYKNKPPFAAVNPNPEPFLWPHINLDDLTKTEPFLLLLKSRARHDPDEFAIADFNSCRIGLVTSNLPRFNNTSHVMRFHGEKTPEAYGKLCLVDAHKTGCNCDGKQCLLPGNGLVVLAIQDRIYDFAVKCCRLILHDISEENLTSGPIQPEPPAISAGNRSSGIMSLSITSLEAPYRLPAEIDLKSLQYIVTTHLQEAEDHIFVLREDPHYFSKSLYDAREHRVEMLPDTRGCKHPRLGPCEDDLWVDIINAYTYDTTEGVERLGILEKRFAELIRLKDQHHDALPSNGSFPKAYEVASNHLLYFLQKEIQKVASNLIDSFKSSPPMRHIYARHPEDDPLDPAARIIYRDHITPTKAEREIMMIFNTLEEDLLEYRYGCKVVLDSLELSMRNDRKVRRLLTPVIANRLANLTIYAECFHQIKLSQPWLDTSELHMVEKDVLEWRYLEDMKYLLRASLAPMPKSLLRLANPSENRFFYPTNRRPSKTDTQMMRKAEANLDKFWDKFLLYMRMLEAFPPRVDAIFSEVSVLMFLFIFKASFKKPYSQNWPVKFGYNLSLHRYEHRRYSKNSTN